MNFTVTEIVTDWMDDVNTALKTELLKTLWIQRESNIPQFEGIRPSILHAWWLHEGDH